MTATPPPTDSAYKLAALQALATGGTQAKAALDTAKAAMAQSQKAATSEAMSAAAQYGLGQPGEQALTQPIDKAYNAAAGVADRVGTGGLARFGAGIQEPTGKLFDAKYAQNAAARRGSGGGGSGSGTTKLDKWFTADLQNQYDTKENLYANIYDEVSGVRGGKPSYQAAREAAAKYGVPSGAAFAQFKPSATFTHWVNGITPGVNKGVTLKQFQTELQGSGLPMADRDYLYKQYASAVAAKPKKKK